MEKNIVVPLLQEFIGANPMVRFPPEGEAEGETLHAPASLHPRFSPLSYLFQTQSFFLSAWEMSVKFPIHGLCLNDTNRLPEPL